MMGPGPQDSYQVRYITCKVCGRDDAKWLGVRGNREYSGAPALAPGEPRMVTNVVRCRHCGFVYTNPLIVLPEDEARQRYHDAQEYVPYATDPSRTLEAKLAFLEGVICRKGRLLDVGAGKGEFVAVARRRGWHAEGIEPSEDFVRHARETYGVELIHATLTDTACEPSSFDAVTLNMVLEHVDDPHALLRDVHRVLVPDGVVLIEVPNLDSLLLKCIRGYFTLAGRDWSPLLSPLHWPYHCYGYGVKTIRILAEQEGFRMLKAKAMDLSARGFRKNSGIGHLEERLRAVVMQVGALLGQGDVLLVCCQKSGVAPAGILQPQRVKPAVRLHAAPRPVAV